MLYSTNNPISKKVKHLNKDYDLIKNKQSVKFTNKSISGTVLVELDFF
jgi:hypothetical protein